MHLMEVGYNLHAQQSRAVPDALLAPNCSCYIYLGFDLFGLGSCAITRHHHAESMLHSKISIVAGPVCYREKKKSCDC